MRDIMHAAAVAHQHRSSDPYNGGRDGRSTPFGFSPTACRQVGGVFHQSRTASIWYGQNLKETAAEDEEGTHTTYAHTYTYRYVP